jgi:hypothetical protein
VKHTLKLATLFILGVALPVSAGAGLPSLATLNVGPYKTVLHGDSEKFHTGVNTISLEINGASEQSQVKLRLFSPTGEVVDVSLKPLINLGGIDAHGGHGAAPHDADAGHAAAGNSDTDSHTERAETESANSNSFDQEAMDMGMSMNEHASMGGGGYDMASMGHAVGSDDHASMGAGHEVSIDAHSNIATPAQGHDVSEDDALNQDTTDHAEAPTTVNSMRGRAKVNATGTWTAELSIEDAGQIYTTETPLEATSDGPNPLYLGTTGFLMIGSLAFGSIRRRTMVPGKEKR